MTKGFIELTLQVKPEDGQYAAYCPELGTASCGDSIEEAFDNLKEAIWVHLNSLETLGERDRVFRERGIAVRAKSSLKPVKRIDVPRDVFVASHVIPANRSARVHV